MVRNPLNVEDLCEKLQEKWAKITVECQNLVNSWDRRCAAVIQIKGLSSKY